MSEETTPPTQPSTPTIPQLPDPVAKVRDKVHLVEAPDVEWEVTSVTRSELRLRRKLPITNNISYASIPVEG